MKEHSKGPWIYARLPTDERLLDFMAPTHFSLTNYERTSPILIAGLFGSNPSDEDANLIRAAPELLAACKLVVERYGHNPLPTVPEEIHVCRAAICKAEGRYE